jgi:hypothetical protein
MRCNMLFCSCMPSLHLYCAGKMPAAHPEISAGL